MMNQTGNQSQQQSGPVAEPLGSQSPAQEAVRYKIRHQTRYQYSENVAVCQNQVRMQPVSRPPCHCLSSDLTITPTPSSQEEHRDYFGNQVTTFSIESLHDSLFVECVSLVQVRASGISVQTRSPRFEEVIGLTDLRSNAIPATDTGFQPLIDEYKNPSRRVRLSDDFAGYARQEFSGGRPILLAALGLTQRIQNDFSYDTTTTDVNTPTEQAFQMRSGVCQDFAHVQLACLRSLGLPARYSPGFQIVIEYSIDLGCRMKLRSGKLLLSAINPFNHILFCDVRTCNHLCPVSPNGFDCPENTFGGNNTVVLLWD